MTLTAPVAEIARREVCPGKTFLTSQFESRARSRNPRTTSAAERTARPCAPAGTICWPGCWLVCCVGDFSYVSTGMLSVTGLTTAAPAIEIPLRAGPDDTWLA